MKKIPLILLLLFLLPLYLIPPTSAAYLDESPQSITSFSETLPDDVLFYPDSFADDTIELADYGEISDESSSPDYILTNVKDGSAFNETTATDIEIWFEVDTTVAGFEGFSYAHFLDVDSGTDVDLAAYDFDQDLFVKIDEPLPSTYAWMNGTIYDPDYWNTTHIAFAMHELSGTADLYWDYGEITLHRMTLADSDHYAEGFNDVSDWIEGVGTFAIEDGDGDSFSTDGDVATLEVNAEDADDYDGYYTNDISYTEAGADALYCEIRYSINTTSIFDLVVLIYDTDDMTGDLTYFPLPKTSTGWQTYKYYMGALTDAGESLWIGSRLVTDQELEFKVDYLRIGPANESGWQHDGSTTEGVEYEVANTEFDYWISSDGDILNVTTKAKVGSPDTDPDPFFKILYDTTTTPTDLEDSYYQFFEIRYKISSSGTYLYAYMGDKTAYSSLVADGQWQTVRLNIAAGGGTAFEYVRLQTDYTYDDNHVGTILIDWVKYYSIANFTVTPHASCEIDDYLYVDSGSIVSTISDDSIWMINDYDLNVDTATYTGWTLNISGSYDTAGNDWRFRPYTHSNLREDNYDLISGDWLTYDELDDFYFYFYDSITLNTIKFIDTRDWQEIGEVEFVIPVGWDPTFIFGYDAFFIFLGLIMIPVSTMYLVRGGREELSSEKLFYFLILFIVGLALLVGGIMP